MEQFNGKSCKYAVYQTIYKVFYRKLSFPWNIEQSPLQGDHYTRCCIPSRLLLTFLVYFGHLWVLL